MSHPHVSIITPSVDGRHHLETFLASVYGQEYPRDAYEVIVVDNGSSDGTDELLERLFPDVEAIRNPENVGFAAANNQGARAARGRYLALLNNDMRLDPGWLRTMVDFAEAASPETVCVGSPTLSWDGSTVDFIDAAMSFDGLGFQLHHGAPANSTEAPDELLFASGAAMLIERETYLEIGGFDDDYFAYYEDVDLGWRLWVLGYRVGLCGDAVAYHRRNASQPAGRHRTSYLLDRNALYSTIKNYDDDSLAVVLPAALMLASVRGVSRSCIPRDVLRPAGRASAAGTGLVNWLRRTWPGRSELEALASVAAIDEIVEQLPRLLEKRRWIQERRRRPDSEIVRLFKTPFPSDESRAVARALGVADHFDSLLGREPVAEPS